MIKYLLLWSLFSSPVEVLDLNKQFTTLVELRREGQLEPAEIYAIDRIAENAEHMLIGEERAQVGAFTSMCNAEMIWFLKPKLKRQQIKKMRRELKEIIEVARGRLGKTLR